MTMQGLALSHGTVYTPHNTLHPKARSIASLNRPRPTKISFSISDGSWLPFPELVAQCKGSQSPCLSSTSPPLLRGGLGSLSHTIPNLTKRRQSNLTPRASHKYPPITEKPKWWWRSLACLPYMIPLHEIVLFVEASYHLHPFLEDFEVLAYPFLGVYGRLPGWLIMLYFTVGHLGIIKRKECPRFFRFHLVMSMLLEMGLQLVGGVSRWMPLSVYLGKLGMHFWTAFAFASAFTILECIRCALAGKYADIPFFSDAAHIHIPYA